MSARRIIDDQFEILRQINVGGFGAIYYGWDLSLDRPVAIKEIVKSLLGDKAYIDMFIDEAMNTARLNHPNIVQVYSLRKTADDRLFIVMQFIEGVDLRQVTVHFRETKERVPENLAVFIIGETCKALEYAHSLTDRRTGQPLNIVHRDVSPSNIMLTVEGSVKLIDFGIAKARNRIAQKTQTGFVKWKVSYLSPEQLEGKDADRRSDIFALGSVFYELLSGQQLFSGDSDLSVMKKIVAGSIDYSPLHDLRVAPGLVKILSRALERDQTRRYQSANEMYVELYEFSRQHYVGEPTSDLSRLVHGLYVKSDEPPEDLAESGVPQHEKIVTKILAGAEAVTPKPEKPVAPTKTAEEGKTIVLKPQPAEGKTVIRGAPPAKPIRSRQPVRGTRPAPAGPRRGGGQPWVFVGAAAIVLVAIGLIWMMTRNKAGTSSEAPRPQGEYRVWINSEPEGAEVFLNDSASGRTPLQVASLPDGSYHLILRYEGAVPIDTQFALSTGQSLTFPNFIFKRAVMIASAPKGARIIINGKELVGQKTPQLVYLPLNDTVNVALEHPSSGAMLNLSAFGDKTDMLRVGEGDDWQYSFDEAKQRYQLMGRFHREVEVNSVPSGADVFLEGKTDRLGQTPGKITLPYGTSKLVFRKEGFKDRPRTVTVDERFAGVVSVELQREVLVTAHAADDPAGEDLQARITRIESGGNVAEVDDTTPTGLLLSGVESRIFLSKPGYQDTSFVVAVGQTEVAAVLTKRVGKPKESASGQTKIDKAVVTFEFKDKETKSGIAGVDVVAERKSDKQKLLLGTTDSDGRLTAYLDEGKYKFISHKSGYKDWDESESVKNGKKYEIKATLKK